MPTQYSYWILPDKQTHALLQQQVNELAATFDGPTFEPHMTLLGSFVSEKELVVSRAAKIAQKLTGMRLSLGKVEFSTTYFQNVFVRVNATATLMDGYVYARDLFGVNPGIVFMPHISLFYGDTDMRIREEIARSVILAPFEWKAAKLVVTPATSDPKGWEHLAEIEIP